MRLVAFAYACEPASGSEPGAGWAWARLLAGLGETWVVTRTNNRLAIEAGLATAPERDRLHFVYVDLPPRLTAWKRGTRGLRLYYVLWQVAALRRSRQLDRSLHFDVSWHLTLANAWMGSLAPLVGRAFAYGPVGGGVGTPWRLAGTLGGRGVAAEVLRTLARAAGRYVNPLARLAWRRAGVILVQNTETRRWLPARHRHKAVVFPNVVLGDDAGVAADDAGRLPRTALYAGRLLPWKGVSLALGAIAALPEWRLLVCGRGPDEARLRALARELGVEDRVAFLGQVERPELLRLMRTSEVFLFPSLHDEAGWVVAEARACGLPVVCLDHGGPPLLGGVPVAVGGRRATVARLAEALRSPGPADPAPDFGFAARAARLASVTGGRLAAADRG